MSHHPRRAFTLIELLVVIAIIGILSAVGYASFNYARQKARDSKAIHDLSAFRTALTSYADDHNGMYPAQKSMVGSDNSPLPALPNDVSTVTVWHPAGPIIPQYSHRYSGPANSYQYFSSSWYPSGGPFASSFVLCYRLEATTPAEYSYCVDNNGTTIKQNSITPCRKDIDVGPSRYNCAQ